MKKTILLLIISTITTVFGQNVRVINQYSRAEKHPVTTFDNIDTVFNLTGKQKIATLKGFSLNTGKLTLATLFNSFWDNTNKLGGNSFIVDSVLSSNDTTKIVITVYYLNEADIKTNLELYPKNMVYVFGDIDKRKTTKKVVFNDRKLLLNPMEFVSCQNTVRGEVTVSIGGLLGAKVWIVGKQGRLPEHLSVSGIGVGPGSVNTIGLSLNTGRIYPVDLNFGRFLVRVLNEQK